jgi:hypothetical protein
MSTSRNGRRPPVRRADLEVAAAVASEAVIQLHVDGALQLIELAAGRVAPLRALEIYLRLLRIGGQDRAVVSNRVLAGLGKPRTAAVRPAEAAADGDEVSDDLAAWQLLRRRLRGRVHVELRRAVELHAGVMQKALLDLHVQHARRFVARLGDDARMDDACRLYTSLVGVPGPVAGLLYPLVLERIAAEEMPRRWAAPAAAPRARATTVA